MMGRRARGDSSKMRSLARRSVPLESRLRNLIKYPVQHIGGLAPTEGWSEGSQNCLHDMRVVGDTQLIRNG